MKLEQAHIDQIKTAFGKMQSKEDLLNVLNQAKPLVYGDKAVPFELKQLTWYANPKLGKKRYTVFKVKKKSGSERIIHAPVKGLKSLQKTLSFILQCVFEPHNAAMGFVRHKSIIDNAKLHVGSNYVYNIDLKDFFPSVDQARIWKCLQLKPFNLSKENSVEPEYMKWEDFKKEYLKTEGPINFYKGKGREFTNTPYGTIYVANNFDDKKDKFVLMGGSFLKSKEGKSLEGTLWLVNKLPTSNRLEIANIIASLCCTEIEVDRKNETGEWQKVKRKVLPQGAPTSPVITNIICQKLDYLLSGVAKRFGLKYSRYADDITFSSIHNVYQPESKFLIELNRIIADQNFHIKESKTRLQKDGYRKEVTGLLVNEKVNVQQRYIKQLRMWLYYWERYGYERASEFFLQQYISDKGYIKKGKPEIANVIAGKLEYLKMVKGIDNELYLKLKIRFEKLTGRYATDTNHLEEIDESTKSDTHMMKFFLNLNHKNIVIPGKDEVKEKSIPFIHKPRELVTLLKNFSVNDSALKYTTHSWDAGRDANMFNDLSDFLAIAKLQYNEFSYSLRTLSENLNGKIYNFLFNNKIAEVGWGDSNLKKRIYFGWSSPELLEACKTDISLNPEDFILPEKFQIQRSGKTLQKFKHIIDIFKNEIEVRDENSALYNLILKKHDNYLISFSAPIISNLENKTFYTDIQWLSKALDLIFEGIQKYPQHPVVEYTVAENNNEILVLTILHRNSFKNGLSIYDDKLNLKRGDFSTIKDKLRNICDWSIESEFAEGAYRLNYLVSDAKIPPYEKIISAEGFKHVLTFYK
jgi:RNA-directed DNA polymerase